MPPQGYPCLGADNRTDLDSFAIPYGGRVISMAINLRQKVELFTEDDMWSTDAHITIPPDATTDLVYPILEEYGINGMHHSNLISSFDGVIGAGLGSSASFAVCLIGAIHRALHIPLERTTIARKAFEIEVGTLGWLGGRQDQWASAFGGFNLMEFGQEVKVTSLSRKWAENLLPFLLLVYAGGRRESRTLQEGLRVLTSEQIDTLTKIKEKTYTAMEYFESYNIEGLGRVLDETWQLKKQSNKGVSNSQVDRIYEIAIKAGAWGGKIMGAGQAGYMLFMCDKTKRENVVQELKKENVEEVYFEADYTGLSTRIL